MTMTAPLAPARIRSTDLFALALVTFDAVEAVARRYDSPDLGLAIACSLARRRLERRMDAAPWLVDADAAALAEHLIDAAPLAGSCEEIVAWLDEFPVRFLAAVDRRARQMAPAPGGRRAWDRISRR